jgi:NAD(P)-dependent dehydrogenase (short-subunit alcohol dehydrogenase family)
MNGRFELSNKVALIVGGRGLLGRRICAAFAESGARVISADLAELSRAATADTTTSLAAADVSQLDVDVTDPNSVDGLLGQVAQIVTAIDILVYSVTAKPKDFYKPFTECSLEGWQTVLRAELDGLFLVTQRVGRLMEQAQRGSIIFLSSIYGIVGNDQRIYQGANLSELYAGVGTEAKQIYSHAVYPAAKGAVISLTRYLAAYWGSQNIRVNCISPGGLAHPGENEEFVRRYSERVPLGRKAGLEEISGAAIFLASDAASYITGHNLVVDGGWTAW